MRNKFFGAKTFRKIWLTLVLKTERQNGKNTSNAIFPSQ